jgi:hypothetical protein
MNALPLAELERCLDLIEHSEGVSYPMTWMPLSSRPWVRAYFWITGGFLSASPPLGLPNGQGLHMAVRNLSISTIPLKVTFQLSQGTLVFSNGRESRSHETLVVCPPALPHPQTVYDRLPILSAMRNGESHWEALKISIRSEKELGSLEDRTSLRILLR